MFKMKRLPKNVVGRDFIVGDLHGCYDDLMSVLGALKFAPNVDRLLSVGDLVDRGPNSFECLQLLAKPWFHAVRGNHEDLMIDGVKHGNSWLWERNGGSWYSALNDSQKAQMVTLTNLADELPHVLVVDGEYLVLHAECLDAQKPGLTLEALEDNLQDVGDRSSGFDIGAPQLTWGRRLFRPWFGRVQTPEDLENDVEMCRGLLNDSKLPPTFVGHTVMHHPLKIGPFHNLDTGAVFESTDRPWHCLSIQQWNGPLWRWQGGKLVEAQWNCVPV